MYASETTTKVGTAPMRKKDSKESEKVDCNTFMNGTVKKRMKIFEMRKTKRGYGASFGKKIFATHVFSAYLVQNMSDLDQKHLQNKSKIFDIYLDIQSLNRNGLLHVRYHEKRHS